MSETPSLVLKRASLSAAQTAKRRASAQPKPRACCRVQKYNSTAGATPKLRKSESESSSAPNLVEPPTRRASRPSSASNIDASAIATTASSHLA